MNTYKRISLFYNNVQTDMIIRLNDPIKDYIDYFVFATRMNTNTPSLYLFGDEFREYQLTFKNIYDMYKPKEALSFKLKGRNTLISSRINETIQDDNKNTSQDISIKNEKKTIKERSLQFLQGIINKDQNIEWIKKPTIFAYE